MVHMGDVSQGVGKGRWQRPLIYEQRGGAFRTRVEKSSTAAAATAAAAAATERREKGRKSERWERRREPMRREKRKAVADQLAG
jgi:hypothetical protein